MDTETNKTESQDKDALKVHFSGLLNNLLREKGLSQRDLARLAGVKPTKINEYCRGNAIPAADTAIAMADALNVSVHELILGTRPMPEIQESAEEALTIPIVDVRLAAGAGRFGFDEDVIGTMSIDETLLQQIGRTTTKGLVIMHAEGGSNEPLIKDGAPIIIDELDTHIRDGFFYAFRLGETLRIKRLRYVLTDVEASSVNPLYPPEIIPYDMRDQFKIIGRALWTGTTL